MWYFLDPSYCHLRITQCSSYQHFMSFLWPASEYVFFLTMILCLNYDNLLHFYFSCDTCRLLEKSFKDCLGPVIGFSLAKFKETVYSAHRTWTQNLLSTSVIQLQMILTLYLKQNPKKDKSNNNSGASKSIK